MAGDGWFQRACAARLRCVVGPGIHPGVRGAAVARHVQHHVDAVQPWHWMVVGTARSSAAPARMREYPDQRDRDTIGIGCDTPQHGCDPCDPIPELTEIVADGLSMRRRLTGPKRGSWAHGG